MSDVSTCAQCGTAIPPVGKEEVAVCPQCGTAESVSSVEQIPMTILPPPSMPSSIPPTPLVTASPGPILPYGELQQAATYLGMARALRGIGIGNIVWGIILITLGLVNIANGQGADTAETIATMGLGVVYGVFGVAFIVEGIWLISAPSAAGLLVAAITMFVTAALFIGGILILAILVLYGVALINRYKKYGPLMAQRPSPAMLAQAGELLDKLRKATRKKSPELVEFSSSDLVSRKLWRGLLLDNLTIFIALETRLIGKSIAEVLFLPPSGLTIEVTRREVIGSWLKGTLYIADQKLTGTIPPECYDRYEAWKRLYQLPM